MRLWIAIVQDEDADGLMQALLQAGVETYAVASTGGLRQRGAVTLLMALRPEDEAITRVLLHEYAHTRMEVRTAGLSERVVEQLGTFLPPPVETTISGAVIFKLRVTRLEQW
jgi:uncharacterized protein YaaQ